MTIALTVIGSGTVAPDAARTAPAHWVEAGQVRLLLDCGAGTLHRAAQLGLPWWSVTHVALTHFHIDHWGELPALLFALRWGTEPARAAPLAVIGPVGLRARLDKLAAAYGPWVTAPETFDLTAREIRPEETVALADDVLLESCKTPHADESLAYAVRHEHRRLVYTGDTGPSEALARWAGGCDLLLAECSLPESRKLDVHLTPQAAGELARAAGARRLVLTHFYPVFGTEDPAAGARERFDGEVVAATDGARFEI